MNRLMLQNRNFRLNCLEEGVSQENTIGKGLTELPLMMLGNKACYNTITWFRGLLPTHLLTSLVNTLKR